MRRLLRDGVATRRGVMAIHQEPAYAGERGRPAAHRGRARRLADAAAVPGLTDEEQDHVIERLTGPFERMAVAGVKA